MTLHQDTTSSFARYLPIEQDALDWGLHVLDAGLTAIPPGSRYPPGQHPREYLFSWETGRVLREYQLVYITKGRGTFESSEIGRNAIEAGHVFLLHPGIWHRYRPMKKIGWDESWIGFDGEYARRLMSRFFPPERAVIRVGYDEELLHLIRTISELIQDAPAGYRQTIAARTTEAFARIRSLSLSYRAADRSAIDKAQQARCYLLAHSAEEVDTHALAKQLGLSYSGFRSLFKTHTGTPPCQYQINIRINKSRELLTNTALSITEIAERVGFSSVYYFSRLFKQKEGCSPKRYRARHLA